MHATQLLPSLVASVACLVLPLASLGAQAIPDRPGGTRAAELTKTRILPLAEAQWTDIHRQLAAKFARDGRAGNDLKTLLHVPEMVEALMPFNIYVSSESSLSPRHRELLILRTAWLCGNQYVWSSHAALAKTLGLAPGEVRELGWRHPRRWLTG
jgi:alkylhydroperoxidase family enzyme